MATYERAPEHDRTVFDVHLAAYIDHDTLTVVRVVHPRDAARLFRDSDDALLVPMPVMVRAAPMEVSLDRDGCRLYSDPPRAYCDAGQLDAFDELDRIDQLYRVSREADARP